MTQEARMVTGIHGLGGATPRSATRGRGGFRLGETPAGAPAAAAPAVGALLALQEVAPTDQARAALVRAEAIADGLRDLQLALLGRGGDALPRLAHALDGAPPEDPVLRDILAALELRARVMLIRTGSETALAR
jgi:hypothetical protein